jgi:hypothetical protein
MSAMKNSFVKKMACVAATAIGWLGVGAAGSQSLAADVPSPVAQVSPAGPVIKPYEFTMFAYGWAAGLNGRVASLPPLPAVDVNLGFDKVLKNFDGGIMGAAELRFGRFLIDTDIMYVRVGGSVQPQGPLFDRASLRSSTFIGTALVGYRLVDEPTYTVDAVAGIRGYSLTTRVTTFSPLPVLNLVRSETESWIDPMVGAKARINLTPSFFLTSWALIGGFGAGSKVSWDVFGGVGYSFNQTTSAVIGYRALGVDYVRGGYVYDVVQKGPMAAFVFRF